MNIRVAVVVLSVTVETVSVISNVCKKLFTVSLVILFLRSLVTTSPIGEFFAWDVASGGLSSTLSRSYSGYKLTIFWLNLSSLNWPDESNIWLFEFNTNKW